MAKSGINDLVVRYAEKFKTSKKDAKNAILQTINTIHEALVEDGGVIFTGEFSLVVKERAARVGVNPQTKEKVSYPAYKTLSVKVGKDLKKEIQ